MSAIEALYKAEAIRQYADCDGPKFSDEAPPTFKDQIEQLKILVRDREALAESRDGPHAHLRS